MGFHGCAGTLRKRKYGTKVRVARKQIMEIDRFNCE